MKLTHQFLKKCCTIFVALFLILYVSTMSVYAAVTDITLGGGNSVSVAENALSGSVAGALASTGGSSSGYTYNLVPVGGSGDADNALFSILGSNLLFGFSPDFENPVDADTNNVYNVRIRSTNNTDSSTREESMTVIITNVDDSGPTIVIINNVAAGPTNSDTINAVLIDGSGIATSTYGFSTDNICDGTDTYPNGFTTGVNFVINTEDNNGKYICFRAEDGLGNISYQVSNNDLNIDVTAPVFSEVAVTSDNFKSTTWAREGDVISMTLSIATPDTWATGNNLTFSIGATTGLSTGNYTSSASAITSRNRNYTVLPGQNGALSFTAMNFRDGAVNTATGFIAPYIPSPNIMVDTTNPVVTFVDNVSAPPVQSDTLNVTVVEDNIDITAYGFSVNATCDSTDTYPFNFTPGVDFVVSDNHNRYVCIYVEDMAGNVAYARSSERLDIDTAAPTITLLGTTPVTQEVFTPYIDAGATASDVRDGDITANISLSGSVDINTVGTYTLIYDVNDTAGNAAPQVTRTVNIVDTGAPTLTLNGADPLTHEAGTAFVDPGAEFSDAYEGTGTVLANEVLDLLTLGNQTLTYDYSDTSANAAPQVSRVVEIVDTTAPIITLLGTDPVDHQYGFPYIDAGAEFSDNLDGTGSVTASGTVDVNTLGANIITYDHTDTSANVAIQKTRTVNVIDTTAPVINLLGTDPVDVLLYTSYTDAGAEFTDNFDGTGSITASGAVIINILGTYTLTYDYTDTHSNTGTQVTRTVNVVTGDTPVLTILGNNPETLEVFTPYVEAGATASDSEDGDISANITLSGSVDTNTVGSYTIEYSITDTQINTATGARIVDIVDTTLPVITLVGDANETALAGSGYTDPGATWSDNYDGTGNIMGVGLLDPNTPGTYTLTYDFTDANGNAGIQLTRTIEITDGHLPTLTLLGNDPEYVEYLGSYNEPGATASDTEDGDISASIIITGVVDTSLLGDTTLLYDVTDSNGNLASANRVVTVQDTTPPTITLLGDAEITLEVGTAYAEQGAVAFDLFDGVSAASISGSVNTALVGDYTLTYNKTDTNGNIATPVTRLVHIVDTTIPTISILGANPVDVEVNTSYTDAGATANDNYDGDITGSIVAISTVDIGTVGTYTVTYDVQDSSGNAALTQTRDVNIKDTTKPVITLIGSSTVNVNVGDSFTDDGANVSDNYDAPTVIYGVGSVNTSATGSYTLDYDHTDANGNVADRVTRTVVVSDTESPVITMLGDNPMYFEYLETYVEPGATVSDNLDTGLTANISGTVDNTTLGDYIIYYNVTDNSGNPAVQVSRTVTVRDTTKPVITLTGTTPLDVLKNTVYTDDGATASDNYDGDITANIITVDPVDANTLGTYTVTYNVTDSEGNDADEVTRTVNVVTGDIPVITLIDGTPFQHEVLNVYSDSGYTANDTEDGDITANVTSSGTVDGNILGMYTLEFSVTDTQDNKVTEIRTVNVVDTVIPTITLLGSPSMSVNENDIYIDDGATASDNYDGDITYRIITGGSVNTSAPGIYTLTYDVSDLSGNNAVQVSRTVEVIAAPKSSSDGGGWGNPRRGTPINYDSLIRTNLANNTSTPLGDEVTSEQDAPQDTSSNDTPQDDTQVTETSDENTQEETSTDETVTDEATQETLDDTLGVLDEDILDDGTSTGDDEANQTDETATGNETENITSTSDENSGKNHIYPDSYIKDLQNKGIIPASPEYDPNETLTRNEFLTLLFKAHQIESDDVELTAVALGLTSKPVNFGGEEMIERVEAVKFVINLRDEALEETDDGGFIDVTVDWEKKYTKRAKELGFIHGHEMPDGTTLFFPHNFMTKGEAAKIIALSAGYRR